MIPYEARGVPPNETNGSQIGPPPIARRRVLRVDASFRRGSGCASSRMTAHEPDEHKLDKIAERRFGPRRSDGRGASSAEARALEELVEERLEAYVAALKGH